MPSALPPVTDLAEATGVVALREPLPERAVARFVRALMAAVADADPEAIVAMSTPDVVGLDTASRGSKNAFRDWLTHLRTKRVAFRRLRGAEIARVDQIVLRRLQDFVERGQAGASPPPEMSPSEVLVTVPVAGTHVGSERLLPDQLVLLLRREAGGYKLSGIQLEP